MEEDRVYQEKQQFIENHKNGKNQFWKNLEKIERPSDSIIGDLMKTSEEVKTYIMKDEFVVYKGEEEKNLLLEKFAEPKNVEEIYDPVQLEYKSLEDKNDVLN